MTTDARDEPRRDRTAAAAATSAVAAAVPASGRDQVALVADPARVGHAEAGLTAGLALIARSLSRSFRPLLAVGVVLAALQLVLVLNASSQQQAQSFGRLAEMLPAFLQRALGDLTLVMVSFQGAVSAGYFHPVIVLLVSFLGIYFGSEPAYDVEAGFVDLLLARPLRRHWLITRSLALILSSTCAAPAIMAITMWVALRAFAPPDAPWPPTANVAKMAMNLAAVAAVSGAFSLLVASRARRRATAIAAAGVTAVFFYLVTFLEPTWTPAQAIGWLSPFHYFHPLNILAARVEPWHDLLVLGVAGALLTAAAYWQFARRDV
jgi:ABC-2 type transport system permease protein